MNNYMIIVEVNGTLESYISQGEDVKHAVINALTVYPFVVTDILAVIKK